MSMSLAETSLGGCFIGDHLIKCAWYESECGALTFRPSSEKLGSNRCDANHRDLIGMCVDETLCTTDASNCKDPSQFVDEFPYCNVEYNRFQDRIRGTQFALWGKCTVGGVGTCVWSKDDCPDDGIFNTPYTLNYYSDNSDSAVKNGILEDDICTCEHTKVGACKKGDEYHCAVSADACGTGYSFLNWQETGLDIDCRVCSPFNHKTHSEPDDFIFNYGRTPWKPSRKVGDMVIASFVGLAVGGVLMAVFMRLYQKSCGPAKSTSSNGPDVTVASGNGNVI